MTTQRAGIVGAGVAGRLLALQLAERGWQIHLFDKGNPDGKESCSYTGAGMIAPYCEQESAEPVICAIGLRSLELWPGILESLPGHVYYQQEGSLVVTHPKDANELNRLQREVEFRDSGESVMRVLDYGGIGDLEPELAGRFVRGLYFPYEAQLDNWQLLEVTTKALMEGDVECSFNTEVEEVNPGNIKVHGERVDFDMVFDCRGLGAQPDLTQLRGVRGELFHVHAPDVGLTRPVRMMHPRYPLYIVPRENDRFVVGATKLESDDLSSISVRGSLELLSAAYALHPGFAEARVLETSTHCRPAMPDNLPHIDFCDRFVRFNGMFRHGFLLAPALTEAVVSQVTQGKVEGPVAEVVSFNGKRSAQA